MRALLFLLVITAVAASASPPAAAQTGPSARATAWSSGYGPEAWKDEGAGPGVVLAGTPFPHLPVGYSGVYENPYAIATTRHSGPGPAWWGLNLTVELAVTDATGSPAAGDFLVRARIETPLGVVPAKLRKIDGNAFEARFDLDGENGRDFPPVPPGRHALVVDVYRATPDPRGPTERAGGATLPVDVAAAVVEAAAVALPDATIPTYRDAAAGNYSAFHPTRLDPDAPFNATVAFARDGAPARGENAELLLVPRLGRISG